MTAESLQSNKHVNNKGSYFVKLNVYILILIDAEKYVSVLIQCVTISVCLNPDILIQPAV